MKRCLIWVSLGIILVSGNLRAMDSSTLLNAVLNDDVELLNDLIEQDADVYAR